jgi:flagellar hook-length control protein fliK
MAEMTIQKSQAFPVGKDLNKGKSLEDNKASLDFNAFLRSSKEDTVKNEGDRKSKSQENSEKKTEQNSIEKDPKEAKLQKGEKKTEKKETKTEEQDSLQGEKAASLVSEKQLLFQKDQLMADIKIAVEEGAVDAVSDLTAVAEPVSIPLTEESALVTVLPEGKEETSALAGNATKKDFSDFLQEDSKDAKDTKTVELKEGASPLEDKSPVEASKEENIIPSQRLEEKLSQRAEEKKSGKEEKLDKVDGHAGQQISLPGSQEKLSESVNAPVREEAVLHSSEAKLPEDVAEFLSNKAELQHGEIKIELEPRNLGQITVKVNYSGGKANIVITAENPKTLHLLQTGAEDMGRILEQKTGELTKIVVQEEHHAPSFQQQGQSNSENKEEAERRQREQQERAQQDNAEGFLQRMRLGLAQ